MTTTTYYDLNIVEGTDIVNPLIVDNPNYNKIDEVMHDNAVSGVTLATEIVNGKVHAITRENPDCAVIRFIATSVWKAGDTVNVDGVPVTALLPSGETLPDGAYVINSNVLCILTGTNLTVYAERKKTEYASEIRYNDTNVADAITALNNDLSSIFMTGWNEIINGWGMIAGATWDVNVHDLTFKPDGYTPVAIMGYSLSGQNAENINIFSLSIDTVSKQISFGAKNVGSTDVTNAVVSIQVLYAKTSSLA